MLADVHGSHTLVGTERYERVRQASADQPLGYRAVLECEEVLVGCALRAYNFGDVASPLLKGRSMRVANDDLRDASAAIRSFAKAHAAVLVPPPPSSDATQVGAAESAADEAATSSGGADGRQAGSSPPRLRRTYTPPATYGRQMSSSGADDFGSSPSASPKKAPLVARASIADLAALQLSASQAFPKTPGATRSGVFGEAAGTSAQHVTFGGIADEEVVASPAVMTSVTRAITTARWIVAIGQRLLQSLSDLHYALCTARGTWLWFAQRGAFWRFAYCLAGMSLTRDARFPTFGAELRARFSGVDAASRHHVALLRYLELHITRAIGSVHAVVTALRSVSEEARDALEMLAPSGTAEADEQLAAVAEQLDAGCTAAIARMNRFFDKKCSVPSECSSAGDAAGHHRSSSERSGGAPTPRQGDQEANRDGADDSENDYDETVDLFVDARAMADNASAWVVDTTKLNQQLAPSVVTTASRRLRMLTAVSVTAGIGFAAYLSQGRGVWARAMQQLEERARDTFHAYVVSPAIGIMDAFLVTPAQAGTAADAESVQRERLALERMVVDYHRDKGWKIDPQEMADIKDAVSRGDLGRVGEDYVESMRSPVLSLLRGRLARLLLIQVQQQKVNADAIVMKLNESLTQNDLTMRLFACFPIGIVTYVTRNALAARQRRRLVPLWADMRLCWWTLHRIMCGIQRGSGVDAAIGHGPLAHRASVERYLSGSASSGDEWGDGQHQQKPPSSEASQVHLHVHRGHHRAMSQEMTRSPNVLPATPPVQLSHPPPRIRKVRSMSTLTAASGSRGGSSDVVSRASWGSDLSPYEEGQVLLQVHAMRLLSHVLWPSKYDDVTRQRFLDDLSDLECVEASRQARLAVLDRMAVSYSFLRAGQFAE